MRRNPSPANPPTLWTRSRKRPPLKPRHPGLPGWELGREGPRPLARRLGTVGVNLGVPATAETMPTPKGRPVAFEVADELDREREAHLQTAERLMHEEDRRRRLEGFYDSGGRFVRLQGMPDPEG
jgi:hypothetical protein